jgi:hypothetical protein
VQQAGSRPAAWPHMHPSLHTCTIRWSGSACYSLSCCCHRCASLHACAVRWNGSACHCLSCRCCRCPQVDRSLASEHEAHARRLLALQAEERELQAEVQQALGRYDAALAAAPPRQAPPAAAGAAAGLLRRWAASCLWSPAGCRSCNAAVHGGMSVHHTRLHDAPPAPPHPTCSHASRRPASTPQQCAAPSSSSAPPGGQQGAGLLPEVAAMHAFEAAHGGRTGGWEAEDHEAFTKVVKQCGGDYTAAVPLLAERLPMYSKSAIIAHAR